MLQGRIGKNIFLKHYLTPTADYKDRVLEKLHNLRKEVVESGVSNQQKQQTTSS